jgi:hypothetical protein
MCLDRPFISLLSACFACITFLHLRWNSCFAMLPTSDCGHIAAPATQQTLAALQAMGSASASTQR